MSEDFRVTATAAGKIPRRWQRRNGEVEVVRVDPRVMRAALKAAGGDASRLVIRGSRLVEVRDDRYGGKS